MSAVRSFIVNGHRFEVVKTGREVTRGSTEFRARRGVFTRDYVRSDGDEKDVLMGFLKDCRKAGQIDAQTAAVPASLVTEVE